ncbi:MAG: glutamine--tRNA ligase/YqeY domain fusion protein [Spirochaetales bacterium]|nr:glutamine--tRNA ligase/YqeY domain fusion protein [Spirochaetales bacterium]
MDIEKSADFIRTIIKKDVSENKNSGKVITRFPPEPNGFLHIGHAKAFCLNFSIAKEFGGRCHLRYDDTNPEKEETRYVESIMEDIRWLGFDWGEHLYYGSDYFDKMYEYAVRLIKDGKAYVDDLSSDQIREYRGTLTRPGTESPARSRSIEENLDLFERMKAGEFKDGERVLRAKIDMASPNMNMRDPVMYRIQHAHHFRQGDKWCIYPMYDWAHGLEDSIEGVTHSLCSLEFENHRPLYDWFLDQLDVHHPQQIEFARLNISYTVLSKRHLLRLVTEGLVDGWDDPRMPTVAGLRRRGVTPTAVKTFIDRVGIAKRDSLVDIALFEHVIREELNQTVFRYMAVLDPLKIVITNYPEEKTEYMTAVNNPERPEDGTRELPFSRELYIEREDFMEDPPKGFFRLAPGREVRLRYAYFLTCNEVVKDRDGSVTELRCTIDPASKGGNSPDGRKVKATLHWVSARHSADAEARLYDNLFNLENPGELKGENFNAYINPDSLEIKPACKIEPALAEADCTGNVQFERIGYFIRDSRQNGGGKPVFIRTVTLKDQWARIQKKQDK